MEVIRNILIPIDFSDCAKNALKVAVRLAQKSGAKLHMLNAVHVPTAHPDMTGGALMEGIMADYDAQVKASFETLSREVVELSSIPHQYERFSAYLTDAIAAEIETKHIDLVVMGTKTRHKKFEKIVGTNAADVAEIASCPVLIIPESTIEFAPKKIGFAVDFKRVKTISSELNFLTYFLDAFQSELLIFHITRNPDQISLEEQNHIAELRKKFGEGRTSVRTAAQENVESGIKNFVEFHQLGLLVMIPRKRGFIARIFSKSITKSIAVETTAPLLNFHAA